MTRVTIDLDDTTYCPILEHCEHLGIDLDQMAAALAAERMAVVPAGNTTGG